MIQVRLEWTSTYASSNCIVAFVKALDIALQSFDVRRQNYHGGAFVGNHIHKTLEVHDI